MPEVVNRYNFDLDQVIKRSLMLHLTDAEIADYHGEYLEAIDQMRVRTHLRRCLICERRAVTWKTLLTLDRVECEAQQARLAEFGDLPYTELRRDLPGLAAHMADCASCRQVYRAQRPLWLEMAQVAEQAGQAVTKTLADGIGLIFNRAGQLGEFGSGLPSLQHNYVGAAMGDEVTRKEWALEDAEAGCRISLTVEGLTTGNAALKCRVESAPSSPVNPARMRIEVRLAENLALRQAGQLSHYQKEPLIISPGSWIIRLEAPADGQKYVWEIPVEVKKDVA